MKCRPFSFSRPRSLRRLVLVHRSVVVACHCAIIGGGEDAVERRVSLLILMGGSRSTDPLFAMKSLRTLK
eukprot:5648215-Pleurochrysis_carterae.AAC.1